MQDLAHDAELGAGEVDGAQAFELVVVVLVRLGDRGQLADPHGQQQAAELVGGVAVGDALEGHQQPPGVWPGG